MSRVGLIAGEGGLPGAVAAALDRAAVAWSCRHLAGHAPAEVPGSRSFVLERLGSVLAEMRSEGVERVCFAGRVARPTLEPGRLDDATRPLAATLASAVGSGDDGALRAAAAVFEGAGFAVVAPQDLVPDLLSVPIVGRPEPGDLTDVARGRAVVAAMGAVDLGQACVVAAGQVLAVEALPGTDWMLASLTEGPAFARPARGVFVKAPKPDQDRRVDLPTIGPDTVARVARAGLAGIAVEAGGTLVLEAAAVEAAARSAGLFVHAFDP